MLEYWYICAYRCMKTTFTERVCIILETT